MEEENIKNDLKKRVYRFSVSIIRFIDGIEVSKRHFGIVDQVIRSATSVGANIIEAKSASSKRDFIKYYQIALKSSNETRYWLFLIRDGLKINSEELKKLIKENDEISKILASCIISLKKKP